MHFRRLMCAAVFVLAGSMPAIAANLIRNGSFENPIVPDGQLRRFSTGQTFSGWTVVGAAGNVDIITKDFSFEGQTFPPPNGNQLLDLTGASDSATGVQQIIDTVRGATYEISLFVGSAYDPEGQLGTSSTVHVLVNGTEIAVLTTRGRSGTPQLWRKFAVQFVAHNTRARIAFINGDPPGDTDCGIDVVAVRQVATP